MSAVPGSIGNARMWRSIEFDAQNIALRWQLAGTGKAGDPVVAKVGNRTTINFENRVRGRIDQARDRRSGKGFLLR